MSESTIASTDATTQPPPPVALELSNTDGAMAAAAEVAVAATDTIATVDAAVAAADAAVGDMDPATATHMYHGTVADAMDAAMAALTPLPPVAKHKTRSTNLTHEQKRLICLFAKQNPTFTQAQLGKWAKEQFGLIVMCHRNCPSPIHSSGATRLST